MTMVIDSWTLFAGEAWAPDDVSGLVLWLDADDAATITHVANAISQWADKSGSANHAAQSTAGAKPTKGTDSTTGRGKVGLDGGDHLSIADAASLDLTTGISVFVACNLTGIASYGVLLGKDDTTWTTAFTIQTGAAGGGADLNMRCNSTVAKIANASSYTSGRHVLAGRYNKTSIRGYVDSNTANGTTAYTSNMSTNSKALTIGGVAAGGFQATGDLYEILIYNSDIGDTDAALVLAYLKTKWGTP